MDIFGKRELTELQKRVLISVVLIPIGIGIMYVGGFIFFMASAIISSMIIYEFLSIATKAGAKPRVLFVIFSNLVMLTTLYLTVRSDYSLALLLLLVELIVYSVVLLVIELWRADSSPILNYSMALGGIIYITLSFCCLLVLRFFEPLLSQFNFWGNAGMWEANLFGVGVDFGFFVVLMVFVSVWICDSVAYFVGMKFGRHKILPRVSPKKSWEGAIAGGIFGMGVVVILSAVFTNLKLIDGIVLGVIVGLFGQVGDFAESMLKREVGIKDSSNAIPGHGGLLDRFDALLFVMPLTFVYLVLKLLWNI